MKTTILLVFITLVVTGCGDSNKERLLKPDQMQAVLWDVLQADSYAQLYLKKDSLKNFDSANLSLQQQVFSIHRIRKEDFYYSFDYYNGRPEEMRTILDSISAKAERNRNNVLQLRYTKKD